MARIPNSSDASSMWKMNDVYVAENGGEWPPEVPPPEKCAFSRGTTGALAGIYNNLANGDGTNIGVGAPINNGWGFGSTSADVMSFQVADSGGWPSSLYTLDWFMAPTPHGGQTQVNNILIRITTGSDLTSNIIYDTSIPVSLVSASTSYQRVDLPASGSIAGNTNLYMNTDYNFAMSWQNTWNTYNGTYFSGASRSLQDFVTLTDGRTIYMGFFNTITGGGGWKTSGNGTTATGSAYGQLYSFGASFP